MPLGEAMDGGAAEAVFLGQISQGHGRGENRTRIRLHTLALVTAFMGDVYGHVPVMVQVGQHALDQRKLALCRISVGNPLYPEAPIMVCVDIDDDTDHAEITRVVLGIEPHDIHLARDTVVATSSSTTGAGNASSRHRRRRRRGRCPEAIRTAEDRIASPPTDDPDWEVKPRPAALPPPLRRPRHPRRRRQPRTPPPDGHHTGVSGRYPL